MGMSVMGMSVMQAVCNGGRGGVGWGGEPQNLDLKLTLTIFLRQICEFHKNN